MGSLTKVKGAVVRETIEYHGKTAQLPAAMVRGVADLLCLCLKRVAHFYFLVFFLHSLFVCVSTSPFFAT